ncbi:MAG: polymerase subunit alpha, partial [Chloroflexi bacterium]|nr:polymerase subunit alpha [Chloroflexota bacterium]
TAAPARRADIPYVSPLRADSAQDAIGVGGLPRIAPAEPIPTHAPSSVHSTDPEWDDEPSLPDEARGRAAQAATATTEPLETSRPDRALHVRFGGAPADQLIRAMETFRQVIRERPGETRVVVHVAGPGGAALPMELKQAVAYDADLLAEIQRRLGEGVAHISFG